MCKCSLSDNNCQITAQRLFFRDQPSWGSGPYMPSYSQSHKVYPQSNNEMTMMSPAPPTEPVVSKSWAELFSEALDDLILFIFPSDESEYALKATDSTDQPSGSFISKNAPVVYYAPPPIYPNNSGSVLDNIQDDFRSFSRG